MDELTIRDSSPHDVDAIAAIYAHYVMHSEVTFEEQVPTRDEMARRRDALIEADYPYLVAERGARVLGYSYASSYRPRSAYRLTVEDSIYLHPDALGQGVGTRLLASLIDRCRAAGFVQMVAVLGGDAPASVALHERLGFRHVGRLSRVGFKFGRLIDSTLLELALDERD